MRCSGANWPLLHGAKSNRSMCFILGRKWRIDFAIVDIKIGIEIECGVWTNGRHTRGKGFVDDMEKYNAAATLGWVILRFTPQDLNKITTFETVLKVVELKKD